MTPQTQSKISNEILTEEMTNKTWKVDFEKNRITEKIDSIESLKQAIYFILNTVRYENIIYSHNYGNEVLNIVGADYSLAKSEIERYIREAILADDRFSEIENYTTEKISSDSILIKFDVYTSSGSTISIEKEVGV